MPFALAAMSSLDSKRFLGLKPKDMDGKTIKELIEELDITDKDLYDLITNDLPFQSATTDWGEYKALGKALYFIEYESSVNGDALDFYRGEGPPAPPTGADISCPPGDLGDLGSI